MPAFLLSYVRRILLYPYGCGYAAVLLRPPLDTLPELRMIDPSVAKIAFIVPFGTAVLVMLWILWNLFKQDKN